MFPKPELLFSLVRSHTTMPIPKRREITYIMRPVVSGLAVHPMQVTFVDVRWLGGESTCIIAELIRETGR